MAQERQAKEATKSQTMHPFYKVGTPCYALYCGPCQSNAPRWVPAVITKVHGIRTFTVCCYPQRHFWKLHLDQLKTRHLSEEENDPTLQTY